MKTKFILFFSCILLSSSLICAHETGSFHSQITKSLETKNYKAAIDSLKNLQANNPKLFTNNNYDYLLARLYEKKGDFASAAAAYQAVVSRNSILKQYALFHLSQIARSTGNLMLERLYLQELSATSGESLLNEATRKRLARSSFESGDFSEAIKFIESAWSNKPKEDDDSIIEKVKEQIPFFEEEMNREDQVLLGNAYLQNKQTDKAREVFTVLIEEVPNKDQPDDFALAGAKGLDLLEVGEKNFGKSVGNLSDEDHFARAEIYQFNRNFSLARLHYQAIIENHKWSDLTGRAIYQIGRSFALERDDKNAIEWFERVQKEFPDDKSAVSALYQSAASYANLDNTKEAVSRYEKYIAENPHAGNLERAYLNIVDAYRDEKNFAAALEWIQKTRAKFKGKRGEAVALFSQIKLHLSRKNWQAALNDLNELKEMKGLGGNLAGGTNIDEITFLRGFVLEKLERFDETLNAYLSVSYGIKSYYGWRAATRIHALKQNKTASDIIEKKFRSFKAAAEKTPNAANAEELKTVLKKALRLTNDKNRRKELKTFLARVYKNLPEYQKYPRGESVNFAREERAKGNEIPAAASHKSLAKELLFLSLYDEGAPELETFLRKKFPGDDNSFAAFGKDEAYTLALFYSRGDMANRAVRYIERIWKKVPDDFEPELMPREQIELLYPKPYETSLIRYSEKNSNDPRFILSIMRQESRFQPSIKSAAAARGLMQFISTTAKKTARELGIEDFRQNDLYDPPTAIRFGSHYISKIFADFPDQPAVVAASYNAGEDRMARWLKRANTDDPDLYVSEIVFAQTKDYVYKVLANYYVYQMIYDEDLKRIR